MIGLVIFLYALTSYIDFRFGRLSLHPLSHQVKTSSDSPTTRG